MGRTMAGRLSALLLVTIFAACSAGSGSEQEAVQMREINYWSMWCDYEPQAAVLKQAAAAFEEESGIHVNLVWVGRSITEYLDDALKAEEVVDLFDDDMKRVCTQLSAYCLDLEEMAAAAGYDDYAVPVLTQAVRSWAGSLRCIPHQPYTTGVFFTLSSFAAAGLVDDQGQPVVPRTWDEFLNTCDALKKAGYLPLAQDEGFVAFLYGYLLARIGGQKTASDLVCSGGWTESDAARQAALCVQELWDKGYLNREGAEPFPQGEDRLGQGSAAMVVSGSWVPFEVTEHTGCEEEWGFFNFPDLGGQDGGTAACVGAQAMAVCRESRDPEAAFQFILYVTSGRWDQEMSKACNNIPADVRNTEWPTLVAGVREDFLAQTSAYDWNMGLNDNPAVFDALWTNLLDLSAGRIDAGQFLQQMDAAYAASGEDVEIS